MSNSILVVDDERGIRQSLRGVLEDKGFTVDTAGSGEECLRLFDKKVYSGVLLDIWLPGIDGLETLSRLRSSFPDIAVVMISGHGNIETAVRATKLGAFDFIEKPLSLDKTILVVKNALKQKRLELDNAALRDELAKDYVMVGDSVPMRALRQQISVVAPTNGRVLIYGESGTGKELVARAIHGTSLRASSQFVEVNCAAIPEELIESELFGHVKGAFTGANGRTGKFEQSDGGNLFLDEVGDMSMKTQAKVLRALEEQRFEPVGGSTTISVDTRVVAATNKRLEEEIERGTFRADLLYRLNVIPFQIPPLRERLEDLTMLTDHFNKRYSQAYKKEQKVFSVSAMDVMRSYAWPGNVRELKNTIERVVILHSKVDISADDLPSLKGEAPAASSFNFNSYREASQVYEREFIARKLAECEGNVSKTAEVMGIDRSHLYRRMKALGFAVDKNQR